MKSKNLIIYISLILICIVFAITFLFSNIVGKFIDVSQIVSSIAFYALVAFGCLLVLYLIVLLMIEKGLLDDKKTIYVFRLITLTILPLLLYVAELFKFRYDDIVNSFVTFNNSLVDKMGIRVDKDELMIITPHCLQFSKCKFKVTGETSNCILCGKCDVGELERIKRDYDITSIIATGGSVARKLIVERRPKLIVAIACERDLFSGIVDMKKALVYGIKNQRPNGPCIDTKFNFEELELLLQKYNIGDNIE